MDIVETMTSPYNWFIDGGCWCRKRHLYSGSLNNGARFFDVGEVYYQLKEKGGFEDADLWPINEETVRLTMESGLPIDFVYTYNIDALLDQNKNVLDVNEIPARVLEWRAIESYAEKYGYIRMGNSWIKELGP